MISGRGLGLFFLFVTSASWIGASFITQALVAPTDDEEAALAPWLLTLICSSTLMLYLPIGHFARKRARYEGRGARVARNYRPRNRPRRGPALGPNGEVALESATGSLLPRRRAAAAAAAAAETGAAADGEDASRDDDDSADGSDAEAGGHGRGGRGGRYVERQPLLHHHPGHKQLIPGQHGDGGSGGGGGGGLVDGPAGGGGSDGGTDGEADEGADVSTVQIVWAAIVVAPVWFAAQLAFTASLEYTSVTSNTVLSSCSSLFVYLGSLAMGQEVGSALRLSSVVAAMGGTTLVALGDRRTETGGEGGVAPGAGSNPLIGDALTLMAAALYAVYTIMMKRMLVKDDGAVMALFFGTIGMIYFSVLAPLAGGLALAGAAVVRRVTGRALTLALIQGLVDYVAADYAWARAVMLLGPTATSCGLAMQIPAAGLIDGFINGSRLSWSDSTASLVKFVLGSLLIICGFIGVSLDPRVVSTAWRRCTECMRRRRPAAGGAVDGGCDVGSSSSCIAVDAPTSHGLEPPGHSRPGSVGGRPPGLGSGNNANSGSGTSSRAFMRAMGLGGGGGGGSAFNDMSYIPLRNTGAAAAPGGAPAAGSRGSSTGGSMGKERG